ncbi:conserved hypothetical protein [Ricinus communis]|uniref:Senescence-associated protein n=1 Tax=Ricinus communis TaxID=3988 RepID=B9RE71_RICCO|nr:conserved hypothetical protein [Ricinus communis]
MARVSNYIISIINVIFIIFGLVALGSGVYIHVHGVNHCQKLMQNPLLIMGVFVLVMSLLGLLGSFMKDNSLLMLYLAMIFFLIFGLIVMTITVFAFVVTHKGDSGIKANDGLGFKEYRLEDFSKWLQMHVVDTYHWIPIKNCLIDAGSGCCKPPTSCDLEYKNATFWTVPTSGLPKNTDTDCTTWNNKQDLLCYDCNSCRAGFLANLRNSYMLLAPYNILTICFLLLTYFVGCCARRSIKYRFWCIEKLAQEFNGMFRIQNLN